MEEVIDNLYRLFAKYSVARPLDICTECCMLIEHESLLASTDVSNISQDLLQEYNDGASTGSTPINEIKHFLPRYLDLINQFLFPSYSCELSLKRLSHNTIDWTPEELILLQRFAVEYFNKCLHTYPLPNFEQIDSIIIMLWHPQFQPKKLLDNWLLNTSKESCLHYRDLVFDGFRSRGSSRMRNAFGDFTIAKPLKQWADDPETQTHFSRIIEKTIIEDTILEEAYLQELSVLYDTLNQNRSCV